MVSLGEKLFYEGKFFPEPFFKTAQTKDFPMLYRFFVRKGNGFNVSAGCSPRRRVWSERDHTRRQKRDCSA